MVAQMTDQSSLRRPPTRLPLTQADVDDLMELRRDADFGNATRARAGPSSEGPQRKGGPQTKGADEDGRRGKTAAQRLGL